MQYQISKFVQFYYSFLRGKGWFSQVSSDFTVLDENKASKIVFQKSLFAI